MDPPTPLSATSTLSGATIQTAERNEFNNAGGNMTKIIVQNYTIDPGPTQGQAGANVISGTSSVGYENTATNARSVLDVYAFVAFFLSLIFTRTPSPSESNAEETAFLDEPPVIVSEIPLDDPLALPIPEASCSPSHRYTRSMLEKGIGYPLYEPQPDCDPFSEYWKKGVRVGDVGIVTADGIFDFLFNVCPSQNPSINPPTIPGDFIEDLDCQVRVVEHFQPNACLFSSGVNRTQDPSGRYTCLGPDGAILELPVGATRFEAKDKLPLKRLAARDAEKWYKYAIMNMGRDAQNGSLYLVTTCIKCTYWGIAVFERPSAPDCLRFIVDEEPVEPPQTSRLKCSWEGLGAFITRVTPNSGSLGTNDTEPLNQCVFLRGYKIELRRDIWDNLENPQSTTRTYTTTSQSADKGKSTRQGNSPNKNNRSQSGTGFGPHSVHGTTSLTQDTKEHVAVTVPAELERVIVHADFSSSPVHPSDLINAALITQRPDAKVALTHDDDWCDMVQDNFSRLKREDLSRIALSYTSVLDEFDCISLKRTDKTTQRANQRLQTSSHSNFYRENQGLRELANAVRRNSLLTDEELNDDLGLRGINLNDTPSSSIFSRSIPTSQPSVLSTPPRRIPVFSIEGAKFPASPYINTPDSGYGGSLDSTVMSISPPTNAAYLESYHLSEAHGMASSASNSSRTASATALSPTTNPQSGIPVDSLNSNELGKGIPLHSVPSSGPLYIVEFKAGRTDLYYPSYQTMDVRIGDWVIVEADRGRDLGKVVSNGIMASEIEAWQRQQTGRVRTSETLAELNEPPTGPVGPDPPGNGKQEINPKMIFAKARPQDIQLMSVKTKDELQALRLCQEKVRAKRLLIEVIDAEYQWDRRKLTFYFVQVSEKSIDFRELVRELFRLYKTRIQMAVLLEQGGKEG